MPTTSCRRLLLLLPALVVWVGAASPGNPEPPAGPVRRVDKNEIVSTEFPCARLRVEPPLEYVGRHPFEIRDVAAGERLVFVDAHEGKVMRLWIAQVEAILPGSSEIYRYGFQGAVEIGGIQFKPGTFAFSTRETPADTPPDEGVLTARFLRAKGYTLPAELMMARFAAVPDPAKRHELIIFYGENVADTGHSLREFYRGDARTALWDGVAKGLSERGLKSFELLPGCAS